MKVESFRERVLSLNLIGCPYLINQRGFYFRDLPNEEFDLISPLYYFPKPINPKAKERKSLDKFIGNTKLGVKLTADNRI